MIDSPTAGHAAEPVVAHGAGSLSLRPYAFEDRDTVEERADHLARRPGWALRGVRWAGAVVIGVI